MDQKPRINRRGAFTIAGLILTGGIFYLTCARGAAAHAITPPQALAAQQVIDPFLHSGDEDLGRMQSTLGDTQTIVQRLVSYPDVPQVPLGRLRGNPFRRGNANSVPSDTVARQDRGDAERVAMLKSVEGLQLQSIVSSDNHEACMINNVLYREGQQIDKFTIDKINENAVVIRGGDYRFELKIQR